MVAKLIVHEPTRDEAIMTGLRALSEYLILGIDTTIPFHLKLMNNDIFRSGSFNTNFLEQYNIMDDESRRLNQMVKVADYSNSNLGKIEIAPEVISVVASIAVSEVEGVTGHFSELKNSNIEKISRKTSIEI